MVADQRMTMVHQRPQNTTLCPIRFNSPSESDNVVGALDGLYMWSSGPIMSVQDFDVSSSTQYIITDVSVVLSFKITDALLIDSVRLSMDWSNGSEILRTWSNTALPSITSTEVTSFDITGLETLTWTMLQMRSLRWIMSVVGQTDDARLDWTQLVSM